jgi:peptidoglycan/LPS O-acetylase OafA/YrhL
MSAPIDPARTSSGRAVVAARSRRHRRSWDTATVGWVAFVSVAFLAFGHAGLFAGVVLWAVQLRWDPPASLVALGAAVALAAAGLTWLVAGVPDLETVYVVSRRAVPSLFAVVGVMGLATAAWRGGTSAAPAPDLDLARAVTQGRGLVRELLTPSRRRERLPEAALMRSLAIVIVVWIHALPPEFEVTRIPFDRWLGDVTRFAVPTFVFVSGYLVARHALPAGWTRTRLERLVTPYLVASFVAIGLRSWSDGFPPIENPLMDLLLGATFGPYYFVFALVTLTLVTPPLLRLRGNAAMVALTGAVAAQVVVELVGGPIFWRVRNPLLWLAFYLGGIVTWRHRERLGAWASAWPFALFAWALVALALVVVPDGTPTRDLLTLAATWLMLATLWLAGRAATELPAAAWWIDGATYPIYLYHLPFVLVVAGPFGSSVLSLGAVVGWAVGLIGAMSVILIGRHLLRGRSSLLLGA